MRQINIKSSKTTITLSEEAKRLAKEGAKIFGGNISAYLTYLLLKEFKESGKSISPLGGAINSPNANLQTISNSKVKTKIKK